MNRDDELNITSRTVADSPDVKNSSDVSEHVPDEAANAAVRPKGVDKPDSELESLNNDLKRVEKRTTM